MATATPLISTARQPDEAWCRIKRTEPGRTRDSWTGRHLLWVPTGFAGTGYRVGDVVADVIGHEWDNRNPEAEFPAPGEPVVENAERLWNEDSSVIDPIPLDDISVLFSGDVVDVLGRRGVAEAVYFESPAGAKVFSSGTNRWTWGLGKAGFVQEPFQVFNRNLVLHFLGRSLSAGSVQAEVPDPHRSAR